MSTNMKSYTGGFLNQETTRPDNQANQQLVEITIYDEEYPITDNPFGIRYKTVNNYDGFIAVTVSWSDLPDAAIGAAFGWYDGTWHDQSVDPLAGSAKLLFPDTAVDNWGFFIDYAVGFDTRVQLGKVTPIDMEMTDTPLVISVVDNDEDKFTPIRSKQAEIQVYSSGVMDIDNFTAGGDNRFSVFIDMPYNQFALFRGFLSLGDLSQDFQPDPNTIILTATDGLGFLNDEVLVTFEGLNPLNVHPIINYFVWALARTGQLLELDVIMNVREVTATPVSDADGGAGHFFKYISLDAKTFEDEVDISLDSYEVLVRLLGNSMFLTQYRGRWRVQRVDELELDKSMTVYRFDPTGGFIVKVEEPVQKQIGLVGNVPLPLSWMNDDAVKSAQRPYKSSILNFNYEYPEELICNQEFTRGEVIIIPDLSGPTGTGRYNLDCWTLRRLFGQPTEVSYYIERKFEYGYEKERYAVITPAPDGATPWAFLESSAILVSERDRVDISVDFRWQDDFGDGEGAVTHYPIRIYMVGNDGRVWHWGNPSSSDITEYYWMDPSTNGAGPTGQDEKSVPVTWVLDTVNETEWQTIAVNLGSLPTSGKLYLGLNQLRQGSEGGDDQPAYFQNIEVNIKPYINGSYQDFTGQRHTVTATGSAPKAVREEEVYISDAPRIAMKGALLKASLSDYVLTQGFYDGARFPDGTLNNIPFGELQSYDVWNQFNRAMMQFEGVVDGLDSSVEIPDLVNTYVLTDADKSTANRLFMVLHYEQDQHLCEFNLFLQELQDSTKPKVYDNHQFKYITANE